MLPAAVQVADPFHLVKHANQRLDDVRRRVQNETLGHRGRRDDPLHRSRRLLARADERLNDNSRDKLVGLLEAGDPPRRGPGSLARQRGRPIDLWPHRPRPRCRVRHPARRRPARRVVSTRGPPAWPNDHEVAFRDLGLVSRSRSERPDRSSEQPHRGRQAQRVRLHRLAELPNPVTALRRPTQLESPRHHQPDLPLRSEAPGILARTRSLIRGLRAPTWTP